MRFFTIIFFILKNIMSDTSFVNINGVLDSEHSKILMCIKNLYTACEEHFNTEMLLFAEGISNMPKEHDNVQPMILKHKECHNRVLETIKKLEAEIIDHIAEEDDAHFHWTKTAVPNLDMYFD